MCWEGVTVGTPGGHGEVGPLTESPDASLVCNGSHPPGQVPGEFFQSG